MRGGGCQPSFSSAWSNPQDLLLYETDYTVTVTLLISGLLYFANSS